MNRQTLWNLAKPAAVLFAICLVVTAALSVTNYFTKDAIAEKARQTVNETMLSLLPGSECTPLTRDGSVTRAELPNGTTATVYLTTAMGYKSEITVMTALDDAGTILGVRVINCADESPGIGQKVAEDEAFLAQFTGQSAPLPQADAITGATYSSRGVEEAVAKALAAFAAGNNAAATTGGDPS